MSFHNRLHVSIVTIWLEKKCIRPNKPVDRSTRSVLKRNYSTDKGTFITINPAFIPRPPARCCMRKPGESLDDYIVPPDPGVTSEPPPAASLRKTGEVEILRPLTRLEVPAKHSRSGFRAFRSAASPQPLWFRRFLALGSGALVIIVLVLVSAILVGITDTETAPDVATSAIPNDEPIQPEELFDLEVSSPSTVAPEIRRIGIIRTSPRRRSVGPRLHLAAIKPKPQPRPSPQPEQPKFIPTTLVIYAENGVINTRIEPWLQFSN